MAQTGSNSLRDRFEPQGATPPLREGEASLMADNAKFRLRTINREKRSGDHLCEPASSLCMNVVDRSNELCEALTQIFHVDRDAEVLAPCQLKHCL
jgi:hypothetical protein